MLIYRGYLTQAQCKGHEICKTSLCSHFLSSFIIDCGLYKENIQHKISVLRTKASVGLMTIFHINSLNTENKIAFPALSMFDSWQNWESGRRLTATVEYVGGKKNSEKI